MVRAINYISLLFEQFKANSSDIGGSEFLRTRKEVNLFKIWYQTILKLVHTNTKCFHAIKSRLYYVNTGDRSSGTMLPGETMFTRSGLTPSGEKLTTGSWSCWVCWAGKPFGWITDVPGEISDIVTGWKLIRRTTAVIKRFF